MDKNSLALALPLTLCFSLSYAQTQPRASDELPLWELGVTTLAVSQAPYPGSDQQVHGGLVLPYFVYRGPLVRADGRSLGLRAVKAASYEVDIGVGLTLGLNPNGVDARQGMPSLGTLLQVGPRIVWKLGRSNGAVWSAQLPFRQVFELRSGVHARGLATEPEIRVAFEHSPRLNWGLSAGALFGDSELNHTLYGVQSHYVRENRPMYDAQSGLTAWRMGFFGGYQVNPEVRVFFQSRWDLLNGASNLNSPLVNVKQSLSTTVGLIYVFGRSSEKAYQSP